MELKQIWSNSNTTSMKVLIEPLWNWNDVERNVLNLMASINRTFMELKPIKKYIEVRNILY